VISRSHTAPSFASTFVRFSDDRRFFAFLVVMLFLFILVVVVVWVLRRQPKAAGRAQIESPSGNISRDMRIHLGGRTLVSDVRGQGQEIRSG